MSVPSNLIQSPISQLPVATPVLTSTVVGVVSGVTSQFQVQDIITAAGVVESVTGTANEITATPTTGDVVLSLPSALTFTGKTITAGTYSSPTLVTPILGVATGTSLALTAGLTALTGVFTGQSSPLTVASASAGVGTISVTASGTTVTGTGTTFTTSFRVGQSITANSETHVISAIASNTSMTTDAWTSTFSGVYTLTNAGNKWFFDANGTIRYADLTATGAQPIGFFNLSPTLTSLAAANANGVVVNPTINQTSGAFASQHIAIAANSTVGATNTQNWTQTLANGGGATSYVCNQGVTSGATGTITAMVGFRATMRNLSATATVTTAAAFQSSITTATGTITNTIGYHSRAQTVGTNNTNILIGTDTPPTGNYAIYDASDRSSVMATAGALMLGGITTAITGVSINGWNPSLIIGPATTGGQGLASLRVSSDVVGAGISFAKARAAATTVQANDVIGYLDWVAHDGTNYGNSVAQIQAIVTGTIGTGVTPGSLLFRTSAVGSNSPTTRLTIDSAGLATFSASVLAHGATAIPAGGTAGAGLLVSSTANFGVFFGSGAPSLSAAKGSLYLRSDGSGINDRMYVNTNGSTTWTAVVTVA